MKILVTGAAGFIGSHLAERLSKEGHDVIGVDNFNDYYSPLLKRSNAKKGSDYGVIMIECDLSTANLIALLPKDINYVFHCAAQPGIASTSTFQDYLSNNVVATENLIDFARQLEDLRLFINIGTSSIYGANVTCSEDELPLPISNYGVTKLSAEQLVLANARSGNFRACSLRLYSVYGSRERPDKLFTKLIDCALNNKSFPLFDGSLLHRRSFTHIYDIIDGVLAVIGKEEICNHEIINLGIDKEYTTKEGLETVERLLGLRINIETFPARSGDQQRTLAIINKARRILNYSPKITLEEGVKEQIEWFRKST